MILNMLINLKYYCHLIKGTISNLPDQIKILSLFLTSDDLKRNI